MGLKSLELKTVVGLLKPPSLFDSKVAHLPFSAQENLLKLQPIFQEDTFWLI